MLTSDIQNKIDEKWDACWPTNNLKPIVILDIVSYLFFLKKISSQQQTNKNNLILSNALFTGSKARTEISGDSFNDLENQNIYTLFASENGIIELEKEYSQNSGYGAFFKGGLLMHPTQKLLDSALGILKLIEDATDDTKPQILNYILYKSELNDPSGHSYLPEYLVELMVEIIRPTKKDIILNPLLGNGSLLAGCFKHIAKKTRNLKNFDPQKLIGLESDTTSLRIGAMNLIVHGINNPEIKALNIFSSLNSVTTEGHTVAIANLIFLPGENNLTIENNSGREATKKEIYYLDFILKNSKHKTRSVVVVPEIALYQIAPEFVDLRQELLENFKLDAVISIEDKKFSQFNGAGILVFSKEVLATTDKVWFYQLSHNIQEKNSKSDFQIVGDLVKQRGGFGDILKHFTDRKKNEESGKGFYVDADEIRARNYNFSYKEYISFQKKDPPTIQHIPIDSDDFPKWEPLKANPATSILQPVLKARSVQKTEPSPAKKLNKQELLNNIRDTFSSKKIPSKKIISRVGLAVLIICIGYLFYWVLNVKNENKPTVRNEIIYDSAKRTHKSNSSSLHSIDSLVNKTNDDILKNGSDGDKKSYRAISKAYFYGSPDLASPEDIYITNTSNETLTSLKEENGFVYVLYFNGKGKSIKGWLNKNDLEEISDSAIADDFNKKTDKNLVDNTNEGTIKYVIKRKAFFYLRPDIKSRVGLYLNKPNHVQLSPLKEENGFVYVVYTNNKGKSTSGWLNKNDLESVEK
jgi:type I restriction enzyme M protein